MDVFKLLSILLILGSLACTNESPPQSAKNATTIEAGESCICPIEKTYQIDVESDEITKQFIDTFSLKGEIAADLKIRKIKLLDASGRAAYVTEKADMYTKRYLYKNDFSKDPRLVDMAIYRNIYCPLYQYNCQQGQSALNAELLSEYKAEMRRIVAKPKPTPRPKKTTKQHLVKLIHGDQCEQVLIDNKIAYAIPSQSQEDYKTFKMSKGEHVIKIIYFSGAEKEIKINVTADETVNHIHY